MCQVGAVVQLFSVQHLCDSVLRGYVPSRFRYFANQQYLLTIQRVCECSYVTKLGTSWDIQIGTLNSSYIECKKNIMQMHLVPFDYNKKSSAMDHF